MSFNDNGANLSPKIFRTNRESQRGNESVQKPDPCRWNLGIIEGKFQEILGHDDKQTEWIITVSICSYSFSSKTLQRLLEGHQDLVARFTSFLGRTFQCGDGWQSNEKTVRFGIPSPRVPKETDARCYAYTIPYTTMIPLCNGY